MPRDVERGSILVCGATGRQGGAVARHLLQHGFHVHALTRHPRQPAAESLRALGARIVEGDMDSPETLKPLMERVRGVFSVQNFWEVGAEREVAEGRLVADLAQAYDLGMVVYSSVGGAERDTGIAHFDSKYAIEEHVRSLPVRWTILRPVWFMENLLRPPMPEAIAGGTLPFPLPPEVPLQMVSVEDIGVFAAMAFMNPEEWGTRSLELAGDEMTIPELAKALGQHLDHPVEYQEVPLEQARQEQGEDAAIMYQWFIDAGYEAPIDQLRVLHPGLMRVRQWLNVAWPASVPARG